METFAEILLALLVVGFVKGYIGGGWNGAFHFLKVKVVGA